MQPVTCFSTFIPLSNHVQKISCTNFYSLFTGILLNELESCRNPAVFEDSNFFNAFIHSIIESYVKTS